MPRSPLYATLNTVSEEQPAASRNRQVPGWPDPLALGLAAHRRALLLRLRWHDSGARERTLRLRGSSDSRYLHDQRTVVGDREQRRRGLTGLQGRIVGQDVIQLPGRLLGGKGLGDTQRPQS